MKALYAAAAAVSLATIVVGAGFPIFLSTSTPVGDIVDFTVGKVLDLLNIEHALPTRWEG